MARKTHRTNFRVEVEPRHPGDFGMASAKGLFPWGDGDPERAAAEQEAACEDIATQIRRHVDGLPTGGRRGVHVLWDAEAICEHCGYAWTEDSDTFNGGCCDRDLENEPEQSAAE